MSPTSIEGSISETTGLLPYDFIENVYHILSYLNSKSINFNQIPTSTTLQKRPRLRTKLPLIEVRSTIS